MYRVCRAYPSGIHYTAWHGSLDVALADAEKRRGTVHDDTTGQVVAFPMWRDAAGAQNHYVRGARYLGLIREQ